MASQKRVDRDSGETIQTILTYQRYAQQAEEYRRLVSIVIQESCAALRTGPLRSRLIALDLTLSSARDREGVVRITEQLIEAVSAIRRSDLLDTVRTPVSFADRMSVLDRQHGLCFSCHDELEGYWELDHHLPRRLGGADDLENRRALCVECHRTQAGQHPDVFYAKTTEGATECA